MMRGMHPLGLGQGLAARGQGRARHGVALDGRSSSASGDAVGGEDGVDGGAVAAPTAGEEHVLAARERTSGPPPLHDRRAARRAGRRWTRPDGTGTPSTQRAVGRLPPAEVVGAVLPRRQLAGLGEGVADAALDLGAEPVDAPLVDDVLQAGPVAILAVAEVPVDRDDGLDDGGQIGVGHPRQGRGQPGVGVVLAGVALAMPPPTSTTKPGWPSRSIGTRPTSWL